MLHLYKVQAEALARLTKCSICLSLKPGVPVSRAMSVCDNDVDICSLARMVITVPSEVVQV